MFYDHLFLNLISATIKMSVLKTLNTLVLTAWLSNHKDNEKNPLIFASFQVWVLFPVNNARLHNVLL